MQTPVFNPAPPPQRTPPEQGATPPRTTPDDAENAFVDALVTAEPTADAALAAPSPPVPTPSVPPAPPFAIEPAPVSAAVPTAAPNAQETTGDAQLLPTERATRPAPRVAAPSIDAPEQPERHERPVQRRATRHTAPREQSAVIPAAARAIAVEASIRTDAPAPATTVEPSGATSASSSTAPSAGVDARGAEDPFSPQVIRGMTAMIGRHGGAMTIRLDPAELGELRITMSIQRGAVTAAFEPTTIETGALLERHMPTLQAALETQGLGVERLAVTPPGESTHGQAADGDERSEGRTRQDAGDGTSRGRRDQEHEDDQKSAAAEWNRIAASLLGRSSS